MNAHKKTLESYDRYKGEICTKERKGISVVEERAEGGAQVHI